MQHAPFESYCLIAYYFVSWCKCLSSDTFDCFVAASLISEPYEIS